MTCIDSQSPRNQINQAFDNSSNQGFDKLDEAFLFSISIVTVLIAIVQAYQTPLTVISLLEITPFLILGVILPFFVGYIRGAINNSKIERLRGWTYLMVGVTAYCALMSSKIPYGILALIPLLVLSIILIQYTEKWFKDKFGFEETTRNMLSFSGTVVSSFAIAYLFVFIIRAISYYEVSTLFLQAIMVFIFLTVVIVVEKLSTDIQTVTIPKVLQKKIEVDIKKSNRRKELLFFTTVLVFANTLMGIGVRGVLKNNYLTVFTLLPAIIGAVILSGPNPVFNNEIVKGIGDLLLGISMFFGSLAICFFIRSGPVDLENEIRYLPKKPN
jgi:hypothetical protein